MRDIFNPGFGVIFCEFCGNPAQRLPEVLGFAPRPSDTQPDAKPMCHSNPEECVGVKRVRFAGDAGLLAVQENKDCLGIP